MNTFLAAVGTILLIAGIALVILFSAIAQKKNEEKRKRWDGEGEFQKVRPYKYPYAVLAVGALLILMSLSFKIVPTGYTGVRTTFGLIDQESCMPGFNFLVPFAQKISLVNNKQQDISFQERVLSETSEQTVVYMENVTVTYQIVPESSAWIYANVENWIEKVIDYNLTSSALKSVTRKLEAANVTDRGVVEPLALEALQAAVDSKYGPERIIIKNLVISNMDFEDSYNQAIAEKSNAMQVQQTQAIQNQTNIDKATAEAEAKRIQAQGEADAEKIRAQGKADANKIISDSITEKTQKQDIIEKWDGQLPKFTGGSTDAAAFGILDSLNE